MLRKSVFLLILALSTAPAYGHICGNQDADNRPNHCEVKKDEIWVHQMSSCEVVEPGKCRYTHCNGSTKLIEDPQCCCLESKECPGAKYVGTCVGESQAFLAPTAPASGPEGQANSGVLKCQGAGQDNVTGSSLFCESDLTQLTIMPTAPGSYSCK
jgi:hypothetical protein